MPVTVSRLTMTFAACAIGGVLVGTSERAHAQSPSPSSSAKAACISAFEQGADLRIGRKLLEARQRLLECGGPTCPVDVQKECAKELELVQQSLPSIVLAARDEAGRDVVEGRVMVDGTVRELDGKAVPLDPGRHMVRFELTGCEPVEQLVLLAEGDKNRPIVGALRCVGKPTPNASSPPSESSTPRTDTGASVPVLPLVLAGVGVVGVAGFAYFGTLGRNEIEDIRATGCAPACKRDEVIDARTKLLVADVFGVAGLVSLGAAAYFAFVAPSSSAAPQRTTTLDVRRTPGGGSELVVRTRF